ncbi:MAG: hypothetical protein ABDH34_05385 [Dictyoglomus thermophilum]
MKKIIAILILLIFNISLAIGLENYKLLFIEARSNQDKKLMQDLIATLENLKNPSISLKLILAECYLEYGIWGAEEKNKKSYFERAFNLSQEVIKADDKNGLAYYIAGISLSRLMGYMNVFQKIRKLTEFDDLMNKALKYIDDKIYKGLILMGLAIRYMEPPWPFGDLKKAEMYLSETEKYLYNYSGLYLQRGRLYIKMGQRDEAEKMLRKVLDMGPHPLFLKAHKENVEEAKSLLTKLRGGESF